MEGIAETFGLTAMRHNKEGYFAGSSELNFYAIVPKGPGFLETLKDAHNRASI